MAKVQDIMTRDVLTMSAETPLADAVEVFASRRIGGAPVCDGKGEVIGMVSVYDLLGKRGKTVADVMSAGAISVDQTATLPELAALMYRQRIRRVPVVVDGKLVGLVTRGDLIRNFNLVHWVCANCGDSVGGYVQPIDCERCGSQNRFELDQRPPGV